ncbi:biotin/lipoyl-binding protein, partial [Pseudomonas aeruginosa]|uniref:biotin/lipoyl-binding protein n=1 Tax=Pseudomonas aeruginosa TaxID=287 RepID=UPI0034E0B335
MNLLQGKWPRLATLLAVLVAAALVFLAWERYTRTPWTRDARVRADVVTLSADVSGLITRLPLSDNQPVEKGELLLSIDPARYELAVLRAERAVNVARVGAERIDQGEHQHGEDRRDEEAADELEPLR